MDVQTQCTTSMEGRYCCVCPPVQCAVLQQPTHYCAHNFNTAAGHAIGLVDPDDL